MLHGHARAGAHSARDQQGSSPTPMSRRKGWGGGAGRRSRPSWTVARQRRPTAAQGHDGRMTRWWWGGRHAAGPTLTSSTGGAHSASTALSPKESPALSGISMFFVDSMQGAQRWPHHTQQNQNVSRHRMGRDDEKAARQAHTLVVHTHHTVAQAAYMHPPLSSRPAPRPAPWRPL